MCAGDSTTLIPLLDLLNHRNGGSLSKYTSPNPGHEIVAYVKLATMAYAPVLHYTALAFNFVIVGNPSSLTACVSPLPGRWQGDEVWAAYAIVAQYESCNQVMLRT